jgi:hypothetical protein
VPAEPEPRTPILSDAELDGLAEQYRLSHVRRLITFEAFLQIALMFREDTERL